MTRRNKVYFIIVAAGGGTRFGGDIPKQFMYLGDKIVLRHSIDTFQKFCAEDGIEGSIILVLSPAGRILWSKQAVALYPGIRIAEGGPTRAYSVANALSLVEDAAAGDIIMVHDGARPLMTVDLLRRLIGTVRSGNKAVVPAIAPTDSLMQKTEGPFAAPVCRSNYIAVQTPQAFDAETLIESYSKKKGDIAAMTDDASVVFSVTGKPIFYIEGEDTNIKITKPSDLPLAEYLVEQCSR